MGKNNKIVKYNIDTFNFNKKSNVRRLEKISKRLDEFQTTNEYSTLFKEAIAEKNLEKVNTIFTKANKINEKYHGSLTNVTSYKTMKNRLAREVKHKAINESKGIQSSGYTRAENREFYDLVSWTFGYVRSQFKNKYYDSNQIIALTHSITENQSKDLTDAIIQIMKDSKELGIKLTSKETRKMLTDLAKSILE